MEGQGVRGQEVPQYSKDIPYSRDLGLRPKASPPLRKGSSQPAAQEEGGQPRAGGKMP